MCPHCHSNNRVADIGADDSARFVCASCGMQFEAMLVEGALVPVLPRDGIAPYVAPPPAEEQDILSIPQEPLAEPPAPQSQVLEDIFVSADTYAPAAPAAPPADEIDPLHITEPAAPRFAPPAAPAFAEEAEEAVVSPAPVVVAAQVTAARPAVDKYAVGMRVLRISPMWLLLSSLGFFAILLMMSWMSQPVVPVGEAVAQLPNQATSRPAQPSVATQVEQAKAAAEKSLPSKQQTPAAANPQPEAPSAQAPTAQKVESFGSSSGSGNFTVQVGSYNDPTEANEHVSRLRAAGFGARAVAAELPGRGTWYRVQAGRFETRDEANKGAAQIRAKGLASAAMVTDIK